MDESIRIAFGGFVPYLHYADAAGMLEWIATTFGFEVKERWEGEDGVVQNAEMVAGGEEVWLDGGGAKPATAGQWIGVWVDDVDAMYERVRATGIEASPPEDKPWGVRVLNVADPEGYVWGFMRRIEA